MFENDISANSYVKYYIKGYQKGLAKGLSEDGAKLYAKEYTMGCVEGYIEGFVISICGIIRLCKRHGDTPADVVRDIVEPFRLTEAEAEELVKLFW